MERDYEALCLRYLKELVAVNTVNLPGNELACCEKTASLLGEEGFSVNIQPTAPGRGNVFSELPFWQSGTEGKPAVILTGHMDVVPVADGWHSDPFAVEEREGLLFGRGTCDMKGGLAAMMAAAVWAKDHRTTVPFRLAFVADEEIYGTGSQKLASSGVLGPVLTAVIGEPTMNRIHIAHRGALRFHVTVRGKSGHAGKPWLCNDPIHAAATVIRAVQAASSDLSSRSQGVLPAPTMCVTEIESGLKDNVIPEICVLTIDTRPGIGDTAESFEKLLRNKIDELGGLPPDTGLEFEPYINVRAGHVEEDSEAVRYCQAAYRKSFGEEPVTEAFPACCDQTYFTGCGIPALLYGPGSIDQAHTTDEFVSKQELFKAFRFYCSLLSA